MAKEQGQERVGRYSTRFGRWALNRWVGRSSRIGQLDQLSAVCCWWLVIASERIDLDSSCIFITCYVHCSNKIVPVPERIIL